MNIRIIFLTFLVSLLALGELMLYIDTRITYGIYFLTIVFFLFAFSRAKKLNDEGILASIFLIIPIIRVIQIFLDLGPLWSNLIVYVCFLYLTFVCIFRFNIKPGFTTNKGYTILFALFIGAVFGLSANQSFESLPFQKEHVFVYLLPLIVFTEELFFRGVLQNHIQEKYGKTLAIIFVSILYAILTLNQGINTFIFFFLTYLIGSMFYTDTKNLFIPIGFSFMVQLFYYVMFIPRF